eukprot:6923784-Pyramimonas_sp.AAC.1
MSKVVLDQTHLAQLETDMVATMREYAPSAAKRAVVVKPDDQLTTADIAAHPKEVSKALHTELKIWLDNRCFEMYDLSQASNFMTSRCVYKWKFMKAGTENFKTIRLRLALRGFMDTEAFDVETFAGIARSQSQRLLASEAARHP